MASRTQSLKSVATWSLRERAVCRRRPGLADQIGQALLDVEVDVLELGRELERAGRDRGLDLLQPAQDRVALRRR